jgi:hypothetical protein
MMNMSFDIISDALIFFIGSYCLFRMTCQLTNLIKIFKNADANSYTCVNIIGVQTDWMRSKLYIHLF